VKTYLPITEREIEPQAVGLYVRQEEVIKCPTGAASIPMQASSKLNLRKIKRANKAGKPVTEISSGKLPQGTILRVSSVHQVTQADPGSGVIDADGSMDYSLVSECLQAPFAAGLFFQAPDVLPLSEDIYAKELEMLKSPGSVPQTLRVVVTPKDGADSAFLFQDASQLDRKANFKVKPGELPISKSPSDILPAGTMLTLEASLSLSGEKEYYRIVEYPSKPAFEGMFLLA
jgi:hypothetical protein